MSGPSPSASMLHNATIETAERNEISNSARDMFKFVQNNYSFNKEGENRAPLLELHDAIVYLLNVVPPFLAEVRKNDRSQSTVSETTGTSGSDPLSQTTSTDHTPQSTISEGDLVDISDIVPADPSSLPVTSIADRYTRSMLKCLAGYPLYEPEPLSELSMEYLHLGVNVGDVGFVRGDGTFDFLFNICPSQNRLINPPMLPGGFSLETSECPATRTMRPLPRETHLFQGPITRTSSSEYTCEGTEGAILELPEGAMQDEAMNVLPFENLAARYGVEWYKYTMSRGRGISNGSLYLITSFTKCAQWGIAVFDRPCASGQGLKFDSGSSSPFSFWKSTSKYEWKGPNTSNTKVANPNQGNFRNQCVFLRGYKIMIRQDIFDNLRKDQRRGSHTPMSPSSPQAGSSSPTFTRQKASRIRGGGGTDPSLRRLTEESLLTKTVKTAVTESDEVVLHPNFNSTLIHPSDIINAALLNQNPGAKVALTHDDVWCNLLRDNFPQVNYGTLMRIALSYTSTLDKYGCVSLGKVSDSSNILGFESSRPVRGTEIPALQVPVQGARDDCNPDIPDISIPAQASIALPTQSIDHSPISGDEGSPGISIPSQATSTTPGLPRPRVRQQRRENKGKANPSTAASLEALHHQESRAPYQENMDTSYHVQEKQRQLEEELKKREEVLGLRLPVNDVRHSQIPSRVIVVCAECKRLKLKCDRRNPCGSCTKRDTISRCIYSPAAAEKVDLYSLNNRLIQVEATLSSITSSQTPPVFQSSFSQIELNTAPSQEQLAPLQEEQRQLEEELEKKQEVERPSVNIPDVWHAGQIRPKITLVCTECKRLKLKCDRRNPCGTCIKRDAISRCIYSPTAAKKVDVHSIHNRLNQVEATLSPLTTPPVFQSSIPQIQPNTIPSQEEQRQLEEEQQNQDENLKKREEEIQIRSRITVVCAECKRLKLKCDRRNPCGSCTERDAVSRCIYYSGAAEKVDLHSLNNRLIHVEATLSLITSSQKPPVFQSSYPQIQPNTEEVKKQEENLMKRLELESHENERQLARLWEERHREETQLKKGEEVLGLQVLESDKIQDLARLPEEQRQQEDATTPELPRRRDSDVRQQREKKRKTNHSTPTSLKASDHQESRDSFVRMSQGVPATITITRQQQGQEEMEEMVPGEELKEMVEAFRKEDRSKRTGGGERKDEEARLKDEANVKGLEA